MRRRDTDTKYGVAVDTTDSTTVALLGLASLALTAAALCFVLRRHAGLASHGHAVEA
jgi:hypothetical protein